MCLKTLPMNAKGTQWIGVGCPVKDHRIMDESPANQTAAKTI